MTDSNANTSEAIWRNSRSGAHAGKGFHYQWLVTALILARQAIGDFPLGAVVPEGEEDCVVDLPERPLWLQIKSTDKARFSESERARFLEGALKKSRHGDGHPDRYVALCLQKPVGDIVQPGLEAVFETMPADTVQVSDAFDLLRQALVQGFEVSDAVAELLAADLHQLVAETAQANANVTYANRVRLTPSSVERRLEGRLTAVDPAATNRALFGGLIEPIDFNEALDEPGFFRGVKAQPGHVAAGLVLERADLEAVALNSEAGRRTLLCGPSGAGKSSALWRIARRLADTHRVFRVSDLAGSLDVPSIVAFIDSRRPRSSAPVAVFLDDAGAAPDLWNDLSADLASRAHVRLVASARNEDLRLLTGTAGTVNIPVGLDDVLARNLYEALQARGETSAPHWRTAFDEASGLVMEYLSLLTSGKRLAEVVGDQITRREEEGRADELALLRLAAFVNRNGGEVNAKRLATETGIDPSSAAKALVRLVDEHVIRERSPGVLGGLHDLRSQALDNRLHDELVYLRIDTLAPALRVVTSDTLSRFVDRLFAAESLLPSDLVLDALADLLRKADSAKIWAEVFLGVGHASLERRARIMIEVAETHQIARGFLDVMSMFAAPSVDMNAFKGLGDLGKFKSAVEAFRARPAGDLRRELVDRLKTRPNTPQPKTVDEVLALVTAVSPMIGSQSLPVDIEFSQVDFGSAPILRVAEFMRALAAHDHSAALGLSEQLGGPAALGERLARERPWLLPVEFQEQEIGLVARCDRLLAGPLGEQDLNDVLVEVCDAMAGLFPNAVRCDCEAIMPNGGSMLIDGHVLASKTIPRSNLPAPSEAAWNRAFQSKVRVVSDSESPAEMAARLADATRTTESLLRRVTEKWGKGKRPAFSGGFREDAIKLIESLQAFPADKVEHCASDGKTVPSLANTIVDIFYHVLAKLDALGSEQNGRPLLLALAAGEGSRRLLAHLSHPLWKHTEQPPHKALQDMSERCSQIRTLALESEFGSRKSNQNTSKTSQNALKFAANLASRRLNQQMNADLNKLGSAMEASGLQTEILRKAHDGDVYTWPIDRVTVLLDVGDHEFAEQALEEGIRVVSEQFDDPQQVTIVPVVSGRILQDWAMRLISGRASQDAAFGEYWSDTLRDRFADTPLARQARQAMESACFISMIAARRAIDQLHEAEAIAFDAAIRGLSDSSSSLSDAMQTHLSDVLGVAIGLLLQAQQCLDDEISTVPVDTRLCERLTNDVSDSPSHFAANWGLALFDLAIAEAAAD
ncbi:ATP-binding protein [Henriciella mobilis]|uniref:AAA+ ATPase domain-containing protein n=1 Tax=Henriciella mobilis TaxID=2305467 RepID=A0A399RS97_9PROT|nr:ATP-binding protein [Henriciella mobilis]RIJ32767.1 hypothetical protein D1223_02665 [Henriciella mobilis]